MNEEINYKTVNFEYLKFLREIQNDAKKDVLDTVLYTLPDIDVAVLEVSLNLDAQKYYYYVKINGKTIKLDINLFDVSENIILENVIKEISKQIYSQLLQKVKK